MSLEKLKSVFSNTEKFVRTDLTTFDSIYDDITLPNQIPVKSITAVTPLPPTPGKQGTDVVNSTLTFNRIGTDVSIPSLTFERVGSDVLLSTLTFELLLFHLYLKIVLLF